MSSETNIPKKGPDKVQCPDCGYFNEIVIENLHTCTCKKCGVDISKIYFSASRRRDT